MKKFVTKEDLKKGLIIKSKEYAEKAKADFEEFSGSEDILGFIESNKIL